jgi:Arc/MetJ-type ribon-helix-helix transcriptional regulator
VRDPDEVPAVERVFGKVIRAPLTTRGLARRGRLSRSLHVAVTTEVLAAIDEVIAAQPSPRPNRADVIRIALNDWLIRAGALKPREDRANLDRHIEHLEGEVAHLKPAASGKPSPSKGMAMLRRARAKSDLAKAKNKRAKGSK